MIQALTRNSGVVKASSAAAVTNSANAPHVIESDAPNACLSTAPKKEQAYFFARWPKPSRAHFFRCCPSAIAFDSRALMNAKQSGNSRCQSTPVIYTCALNPLVAEPSQQQAPPRRGAQLRTGRLWGGGGILVKHFLHKVLTAGRPHRRIAGSRPSVGTGLCRLFQLLSRPSVERGGFADAGKRLATKLEIGDNDRFCQSGERHPKAQHGPRNRRSLRPLRLSARI